MTDLPDETAAVPYDPPPDDAPRSRARAVKERHEQRLLDLPGVEGVGLAERGGAEAILLYLRDEASRSGVPTQIDGVQVACEITGPIAAL